MFVSTVLKEALQILMDVEPKPRDVISSYGELPLELRRLYVVMTHRRAALKKMHNSAEVSESPSSELLRAHAEYALVEDLFWGEVGVLFPETRQRSKDSKLAIAPGWLVALVK